MKTNRLFHMEQKLVALCVASVLLTGGAELLYARNNQITESPALLPSVNTEEALEQIILATENTEVARLINLGLQDALLGYDSRARVFFYRALELEPHAPLALCGLMMLEQHNRSDYTQQLKRLTDVINSPDFMATPQEMFYVETFLKLISGDVIGAAEDFRNRSKKYRADILSACWSVTLLHAAQDTSAMQQAEELHKKHPQHPLCSFVYCRLFESSATVPQEIETLAYNCAENLNHHPIALHLAAHLLFHNSKLNDASRLLHEERTKLMADISTQNIPQHDAYELLRAELYLVSIQNSYPASMKLFRDYFSEHSMGKDLLTRKDVLFRWEMMTLPMRLLILRADVPDADEVRAALAYNVPHETFIEDDAAHHFGECLKKILQLRVLHAGKRIKKAHALLQQAEYHFKQLRDNRTHLAQKSISYLVCYQRALDCADTSLSFARSLLYTDSSSMWKDKVDSSLNQQSQSRMLPPMLLKK